MSLLKQVVENEQLNEAAKQRYSNICTDLDLNVQSVNEAVTHVLANLADAAASGSAFKSMNPASAAGFLAGVHYLVMAIPRSQDTEEIEKVKGLLTSVRVNPDGFVSSEAALIAQIGRKYPQMNDRYVEIVRDYVTAVKAGQTPTPELLKTIKLLQQQIDAVMSKPTPKKAVA